MKNTKPAFTDELPLEPAAVACVVKTPEAANCRKWFWLITLSTGVLWIIAFLVALKNYRPDVIEQILVGQEWVLGSTKHPGLTAILMDLASRLTFHAEMAPYLLTRLCVLLSLWAVWQTAREFLSERLALLAVVAMSNYWFFQFESSLYNNNVTLNMSWACGVLFTIRAFRTNRFLWWFLAGVAIGLGIYLKYTMVILPFFILLFLLFDREGRRLWRKPGPWISTLTAILIFLPLALWIVRNDCATLGYAAHLPKSENWYGHLLCPINFTVEQLLFLIPVTIPLIPVCGWIGKPARFRMGQTLSSRFLLTIFLGPFLLQVLISGIKAVELRGALGCHLWLFFTILLLCLLQSDDRKEKVRQGIILSLCLALFFMAGSIAGVAAAPWVKHRGSRYHFPGRALAVEVEKIWHTDHDQPLPWVVGPWWQAGNVTAYGQDRARVHAHVRMEEFLEGIPLTTWSTLDDVRRDGGIIMWRIPTDESSEYCPPKLLELFPRAKVVHSLDLPYQTSVPVPHERIGIAVIEPESVTVPAPALSDPEGNRNKEEP